MTDSPDISDPFLQLLTDALRAGPGSPEWHQAVAKLKTGDQTNADEYQLLLSARQNLESGRGYREVKPGAEFTRKILTSIENEPAKKSRRIPTANIIAGLGMFIILFVVGFVFFALRGSSNTLVTIFRTHISAPSPLPLLLTARSRRHGKRSDHFRCDRKKDRFGRSPRNHRRTILAVESCAACRWRRINPSPSKPRFIFSM